MNQKRTGKRLALIIASYEYQDPSLQQLVTPAQDAEALARVLKDPDIGGFDEVKVLTNRPSHEVRVEVASFFANRQLNDLLLLYFSGHGVKDDRGRLYLTTTDTQRKLLRPTALPTTFVNDTMSDSRSRRQVLILDCCHGGAFARDMIPKGGESVDIDQRFEGRGRVVLTASTSTQYAFQGDEVVGEGSRSVFTHHLVQGLETGKADLDGDGWVSLDELYDYVHDRVTDETPQQTPGKWVFDMRGDIIVAHNPHWTVEPATLPPELQQAIESPFVGVREGAVSELERMLHGSDVGLALAARQALTLLVDDDSRRVSAAAATILAAHAKAEQETQTAKEREQEEQERRVHEQAEAERLVAQKAEAERVEREKAEKEHRARRRKLDTLYQQAQTKIAAKAWAEAKDLCQQIKALESDYGDVGKLLSQAEEGLRQEQAQKEREAQLAQLYERLQEVIKDQDWAEAETQCREILTLEPEYRDVSKLQAQVQEAQARQQKLEKLYRQAQTQAKSRVWTEVKDLCQQIETLESGYRDTDQLLKRAKEKLQEEQAQKERQRLARLAAKKAEAEPAITEKVEAELSADEEEGADVSVLPSPPALSKPDTVLPRLSWSRAAAILAPGVILFVLLQGLPMLRVMLFSFQEYDFGITTFVGLDNYARLVADSRAGLALRNTIGLVLIRLFVVSAVWWVLRAAWRKQQRVPTWLVLVAVAPLPFLFSMGNTVCWMYLGHPGYGPLGETLSWFSSSYAWVLLLIVDGLNTLAISASGGLVVYALLQKRRGAVPHSLLAALNTVRNVMLIVAAASALRSSTTLSLLVSSIGRSNNTLLTAMYVQQYRYRDYGYSAVYATILLIALIILAWILWRTLKTTSLRLILLSPADKAPDDRVTPSPGLWTLGILPGMVILLPYVWLLGFILPQLDHASGLPWGRYLANSLIGPGLAVWVVQLPIAFLTAYAIALRRLPGKTTSQVMLLLFVLAAIVGKEVASTPLSDTMRAFDWLDTAWGAALPLFSGGATVVLFVLLLKGLAPRWVQVRDHGEPEISILRQNILPVAKPAILLVGLGVHYWASQWLFWPLIVLNSPYKYTVSLRLYSVLDSLLSGFSIDPSIPIFVFPIAIPCAILIVFLLRIVLRQMTLTVGEE